MKFYKKGISQQIILDQTGIGAGKTIKVSIVGENGSFLNKTLETTAEVQLRHG